MVAGPALATDTFATGFTFRVADATAALLPAFVVNAPASTVFVYAPVVVAVTSIWNVHDPFAGTTPPVNVTLPAVLVTAPPEHVVDVLPTPDRWRPLPGPTGNVSVTFKTEMGPALGLVIVTTNVDTPPEMIGEVVKFLAIVGAVAVTVRFAVLEAAPVGACVLETPDVKFGCVPAVLLTMVTITVQVPLAGMFSPVKVRLV